MAHQTETNDEGSKEQGYASRICDFYAINGEDNYFHVGIAPLLRSLVADL